MTLDPVRSSGVMRQITFEQLRRTLDTLHRAVGRLMTEMGSPNSDSPATRDIEKGGEPANSTRSLAELAIISAADHMSSLERVLTEPVMTFSPWTTARGALETASTAMWLLEDIDFRTRMARGLTLRLEHLNDERIYARDAGKRRPDVSSLAEAIPNLEARVQHLIGLAKEFSIPEKCDSRGRLIGFGETMPTNTELADRAFGEGSVYRLLSAVGHNRTWATLALSLRAINTATEVEPHMRLEAAQFLVISAIGWFARVVWAYFKYNGWDMQKLTFVLESSYDQAALVEKGRFWRKGGPT